MSNLSESETASREKTLVSSLLVSAPGVVLAAVALVMSTSTTQLADLVRRSMDLLAIVISWWVFRKVHRESTPSDTDRTRLERFAGLSVAGAMIGSGLVLLGLALSRLRAFTPGGTVYLGMLMVAVGLVVNTGFWRRYARLEREKAEAVMEAQTRLYLAKAGVDLAVLAALTTVALAPSRSATRYFDLVGSAVVAVYLLWSGLRTARPHVPGGKGLRSRLRKPDSC
jgi:divalent metal cation (Fe/Co/Zn/Cd) transporter